MQDDGARRGLATRPLSRSGWRIYRAVPLLHASPRFAALIVEHPANLSFIFLRAS
jgi:hypothetical protein